MCAEPLPPARQRSNESTDLRHRDVGHGRHSDRRDLITARPAPALYEANWRHVDEASLQPAERALIARLTTQYGHGVMNV